MNDEHNPNNEEDVIFDDENPDINAQSSIKKVREKLKAAEEKASEYLTGWQKAKADLVNLRKEDERRLTERVKFAEEALILDLLPVLDSFEMAFSNKEVWDTLPKEWRTGMESIQTQFIKILETYGATVLDPQGEPFSPHYHEAIGTEKTNTEDNDGKIIHVIQKGFIMHDKVIRTAKVIVGEYHKE